MQVLILGGSGRTGKWVVDLALEKGHAVRCLVRDKAAIHTQHDMLELLEGSPIDKSILAQAMHNCTAVISALNISRTSDFPWAKLRTPKTFLADVMKNIIEVAPEGMDHVIICSAWGVADTKADLPGWFRWVIEHSNVGAAYLGHEDQERLLKESSLPWTTVRPVGLINSQKRKPLKVQHDHSSKPSLTVSRKDVAEFLVDCLERKDLIRTSPTISY